MNFPPLALIRIDDPLQISHENPITGPPATALWGLWMMGPPWNWFPSWLVPWFLGSRWDDSRAPCQTKAGRSANSLHMLDVCTFFPVADTMQWSSRSYFGVDALTYLHWEDHGFASNLISVPIGMVNPVAILASRSLKWWFIHHFQADKGFFKGCSVL